MMPRANQIFRERAARIDLDAPTIAAITGIDLADAEACFSGNSPIPPVVMALTALWGSANASCKNRVRSIIMPIKREKEIWKSIPLASRYEVSDQGRVRRAAFGPRTAQGYILKPHESRSKHLKVTVYRDDGSQWRVGIHALVALVFVGPPPFVGAIVLHRDGIAWNNTPTNLRWGTTLENGQDTRRHRLAKFSALRRASQVREQLNN